VKDCRKRSRDGVRSSLFDSCSIYLFKQPKSSKRKFPADWIEVEKSDPKPKYKCGVLGCEEKKAWKSRKSANLHIENNHQREIAQLLPNLVCDFVPNTLIWS